MGFLFCGIILVLEIFATSITIKRNRWGIFRFYTQLSNLLAALSCLLYLVTGGAAWTAYPRFVATSMLIMTCAVTVLVLWPMGGDPKFLLLSRHGLPHHLLCPILSTISYVCFEAHAGEDVVLIPVLITLVYGSIMLYLNGIRRVDGPYPFFRVHHQSVAATILWVIVLLGVSLGFSVLLQMMAPSC